MEAHLLKNGVRDINWLDISSNPQSFSQIQILVIFNESLDLCMKSTFEHYAS